MTDFDASPVLIPGVTEETNVASQFKAWFIYSFVATSIITLWALYFLLRLMISCCRGADAEDRPDHLEFQIYWVMPWVLGGLEVISFIWVTLIRIMSDYGQACSEEILKSSGRFTLIVFWIQVALVVLSCFGAFMINIGMCKNYPFNKH